MRILFITPYLPSQIRVRPYQFLREMGRQHEIHLVATTAKAEVHHAAALDGLCRRVDLLPLRLAESLQSCAGAALHGEPLQAAYCRSPRFASRLSKALREERFDVVHVEHLRAAHVVDIVPAQVPTVYDAVDCISLLLLRTLRSSHSLRQRLIAALELKRTRDYEAKMVSRFDRVAATSPEDAAALEALRPGVQVAVVPNGVDLDYFQPLPGSREPATLVISGKMSYHANVTAVLRFVHHVFPLVRQRHPEARLRIVGANPPRKVLDLSRDPTIEVTGFLPDIRQALGTAAIAVCPVTVKVGIQNKILEAMAMGLPVVSTRAGAEGLQIQPERDALVASDWREFAHQICRVLDDPGLCARLGTAGRQYVETHHQWNASARRLEVLYDEAIEQRRQVASVPIPPLPGR